MFNLKIISPRGFRPFSLTKPFVLLGLLMSFVTWAETAIEDPRLPLKEAWSEARTGSKSVMLVLGAKWCDRCELLSRYMTEENLRTRIDKRFVVLHMDVGEPQSLISLEDTDVQLPVIVLLDSSEQFEDLMQSNSLLTFLPEPFEPIYDWLENVLFYTEQAFAAR